MTAIPLRLRIQQGLTDVLKGVTPAHGYQHDLSDFIDKNGETRTRVFRGRNIFGSSDPIPMISILESPHAEPSMQDFPPGAGVNVGPWDLLIQGFVEDDPVNPTDNAHLLMADVKLALIRERQAAYGGNPSPNIFGTGRAVRDIKIGTGVVRPPDDVSAYACFWLTLTLTIGENLLDPFA